MESTFGEDSRRRRDSYRFLIVLSGQFTSAGFHSSTWRYCYFIADFLNILLTVDEIGASEMHQKPRQERQLLTASWISSMIPGRFSWRNPQTPAFFMHQIVGIHCFVMSTSATPRNILLLMLFPPLSCPSSFTNGSPTKLFNTLENTWGNTQIYSVSPMMMIQLSFECHCKRRVFLIFFGSISG